MYFLDCSIEKFSQMQGFFCYFQTAKAVLESIITNEEHSNEFWLAQSCIVAKWNFTLFYILLARSAWYAKQTS